MGNLYPTFQLALMTITKLKLQYDIFNFFFAITTDQKIKFNSKMVERTNREGK